MARSGHGDLPVGVQASELDRRRVERARSRALSAADFLGSYWNAGSDPGKGRPVTPDSHPLRGEERKFLGAQFGFCLGRCASCSRLSRA